MTASEKSSRPVWLGRDERRFDHVQVHFQILQDKRLGAFEIAVYVALVMHAETGTGKCWPSAETLGEYVNGSDRTVRRCIKVLADAGYIRLEREAGRANTYYLLSPPVIHTPVTGSGVTPERQSPPPRNRVTTGGDSVSDELEPRTRTKNERFRFGSVPESYEGCGRCEGGIILNDDLIATRCVCRTEAVGQG